MLEEDKWAITEQDKLDYLLDSIQNTGLSAAVSTISMSCNPLSRKLQKFCFVMPIEEKGQ